MIETYIQEFLAVVTYLIQHDKGRIKKHLLIVEKPLVCQLLDRNMYEMDYTKLAVWRDLRWIRTEPDRFTKRIMVDGKIMANMIQIDLIVYETLKRLTKIR